MSQRGFESDRDTYYVRAVLSAVEHTCDVCANGALVEAYLVLAWEFQRRGIEPEPAAVVDGAQLVSRGRMPAVMACVP